LYHLPPQQRACKDLSLIGFKDAATGQLQAAHESPTWLQQAAASTTVKASAACFYAAASDWVGRGLRNCGKQHVDVIIYEHKAMVNEGF
jgi:hypothetical protein